MDASLFEGNVVKSNRIIYTPSQFAKANLIHLQEIGELHAQKPHASRRENLQSFLFFIVLSGSGHLEYGGQQYPLSKGDCVFIDCRRPYSHYTADDLWTLKWAHFYGPTMNGIYEKYMERGGRPCFLPKTPDAFDAALDAVFELAGSNVYVRDMKICEKLTCLLSLLMEEGWNPGQSAAALSQKQNLQKVKEYLEQHYFEKITLDYLAEIFYINKFYLTRMFKEQFGTTLGSYLLQIRITHAKQLLRFTDKTIERIGQECGMNDANYFSRIFKKIEGIPPGEYRKRW